MRQSLRYASWLLLLFILLSCSHRVTGEATALPPILQAEDVYKRQGNIDLLARHTEHPDEAVFLWKMAENIAGYFHAEERVHVISNACISGVSALIAGKRMIENGIYRRVIVAGGDLLSHFITSGFGSFRSLSSRPVSYTHLDVYKRQVQINIPAPHANFI